MTPANEGMQAARPDGTPASPFAFAVNGQPTQITTAPETPISAVITTAILQTENERWGGEDAWEARNPRGELIDGSARLGDLVPNERGICAFIQLKPGVFA